MLSDPAFSAVLTALQPKLRKAAYELARTKQASEDLLQDTNLRCWEKRNLCRVDEKPCPPDKTEAYWQEGAVLAWAKLVMKNIHINQQEKEKRNPVVRSTDAIRERILNGYGGESLESKTLRAASAAEEAEDEGVHDDIEYRHLWQWLDVVLEPEERLILKRWVEGDYQREIGVLLASIGRTSKKTKGQGTSQESVSNELSAILDKVRALVAEQGFSFRD